MSDLNSAWEQFASKIDQPQEVKTETPPQEQETVAVEAVPPEPTAVAEPAPEDPPRDEKGRFIPLNRHEEVLRAARAEAAAERARVEELTAKLAELDTKPKQVQADAEFEDGIKELPEGLQNVMRAERLARLEVEKRLAQTEAERQQAVLMAQATRQEAEHQAALATVPVLAKAYDDPIRRAAIDAISDAMVGTQGYVVESLPAHYAAVEAKYIELFGPAKQAAAPVATKPLPPPVSAPASLSGIKTGAAPAAPGNEFESMSLFESVAATRKLTPDQRQAAFFRPQP